MKEMKVFDKDAQRVAFVEGYLSGMSCKEAATNAGIPEDQAYQYLNTKRTLGVLRERLPQRNPDEMARVYGWYMGYLREAECRYRAIKEEEERVAREVEGSADRKEGWRLDFIRQQNNMRFQQLLTAADMVGRACGLGTKVNLGGGVGGVGGDEGGVKVVREVNIVVNVPAPVKELKEVEGMCKVLPLGAVDEAD